MPRDPDAMPWAHIPEPDDPRVRRRNRNVAQRMRMRLDPRPLLRDEAKTGKTSKPSEAGRP